MKRAALLVLLACRCTLLVDGLVDHPTDAGGSGGGSTGGGAMGGGGGSAGGGGGGGAIGGGGGGSNDGGTDAGIDGGTDAGIDGGTDAGIDGGTDAGIDGGTDAGIAQCGPNPMLSCREVTRANGEFYDNIWLAVGDDALYLAVPVDGLNGGIDLVRYTPLDGGLLSQRIDAGTLDEIGLGAEGSHWVLAWTVKSGANVDVFCATDSAATTTFEITNESLGYVSPAISASGNVLLSAGPSYDTKAYVFGRLGDGGCPGGLDQIVAAHPTYGVAALHRPNTADEGFELIDVATVSAVVSSVDVTTFTGDAGMVSYGYSTEDGAGLFSAALLPDGGFVLTVEDALVNDVFVGVPAGNSFDTGAGNVLGAPYTWNISSCGNDGCVAVPYSLTDGNHNSDGVLSVAIAHSATSTYSFHDVICDGGTGGIGGVNSVASAYLDGKFYVAWSDVDHDISSVYVIYECTVPP